jgi:hypothetical protein
MKPENGNPRVYAEEIRQILDDTAERLRVDIEHVDDPRAKALFETTREVIHALSLACAHYQADAPAWHP